MDLWMVTRSVAVSSRLFFHCGQIGSECWQWLEKSGQPQASDRRSVKTQVVSYIRQSPSGRECHGDHQENMLPKSREDKNSDRGCSNSSSKDAIAGKVVTPKCIKGPNLSFHRCTHASRNGARAIAPSTKREVRPWQTPRTLVALSGNGVWFDYSTLSNAL